MAMNEELRNAYMDGAGLSGQQLEESVGRFTRATAVFKLEVAADEELEKARDGVRQAMVDVTIIQAKHSTRSRRAQQDARAVTDAAELETDRQLLSEILADEYQLINPFGKAEGKWEVINRILAGTIQPAVHGHDGFETLETELHVVSTLHGIESVVCTGTFAMSGSGRSREHGGATGWRDLSGVYKTSHSFVFRDGRWQETQAQMTLVPSGQDFEFAE